MLHDKLMNSYNFIVDWGGNQGGFMEISGLNMEIEPISVRNGNFKEEIELKIPGLLRFSEVSFKRGIVVNDNDFFKWINTKSSGTIERRNITITMLNDQQKPVIVWRLRNCFPTKYIGPVLMANDSNIAVETLVVVHEGMEIEPMG